MAVDALVVVAHPFGGQRHADAVEDALADHRVVAHQLHLVLREAALVLDDSVGQSEDADVVQESGRYQVLEPLRVLVETEPEPEPDRVARDAIRVMTSERIARLERERKCADDIVFQAGFVAHNLTLSTALSAGAAVA